MRRALVVLAIGAALLAVATVSGIAWGSRQAPDWIRASIEESLSESLEAPVDLPFLRLGFRGGLRLVARNAAFGPTAMGHRLEAEQITARLDLIAMATGQLRLDRLEAEGAVVGLAGPGAAGLEALAQWLEGLKRLRAAAVRQVEIRSAQLDEIGVDGARIPLLLGLSVRSVRSRLRPQLDLEIHGQLPGQLKKGGAAELVLNLTHEDLDVALDLDAIDLARLPAPLRRLLPAGSPVGRISGVARLERRDQRHSIDLALTGHGVAGRVPGGPAGPAGAFVLNEPKLTARIRVDPSQFRLVSARLEDGDIPISVEGSLELPWVPTSKVASKLVLGRLSAEDLRGLARRIPNPIQGSERLLKRIEACSLEDLTLELESTRAGLEEMLARDLLARPGEFRVSGAVSGARVALQAEGQVENHLDELSGRIAYDGEQLVIEELRAQLGDEALPQLDAVFDGLSNIRGWDEVRCVRPKGNPATAGVPPLFRWLRSFRKEPRPPPSWQRLEIEIDEISHPAFLCAAEQLTGTVLPIPGGVDFEVERGVWAGMAVSGSGRVMNEGQRSVRLDLSVGSVFEAQALTPPTDPWARGRFRWDATRIGAWRVLGADGAFHLSGTTLVLEDAELDLDPGGTLAAGVRVDMANPEALQLEVDLAAEDLDLTEFVGSFRAKDPGRVVGRLGGRVHFEGPLIERRSPLATSTGQLSLHAHDGWLASDLPLLAALVVAESPFEPIRGLDQIAFDDFSLEASLADGVLDSPEFQLEGPTLRMAGAGRLEVERPLQTDAVLGLLLFPQVDSLIGRLPVINRVILGAQGNLIGAYYTIEGPWNEPQARLIPVKSLVSSGPASFVLQDVPSFLWSGIKRIHGILLPTGAQTPRARPPEKARADS